jgi:hypothetical protein
MICKCGSILGKNWANCGECWHSRVLVTGRLDTGCLNPTGPALQNIPINSDLGLEIRKKMEGR